MVQGQQKEDYMASSEISPMSNLESKSSAEANKTSKNPVFDTAITVDLGHDSTYGSY